MGSSFGVSFSPEAGQDLLDLYTFIADRSGEDRAIAYIDRIEAYCLAFRSMPERGACRDDLRPGLRIVGFERRLTIAFHVTGDEVVNAGRNPRIFAATSFIVDI